MSHRTRSDLEPVAPGPPTAEAASAERDAHRHGERRAAARKAKAHRIQTLEHELAGVRRELHDAQQELHHTQRELHAARQALARHREH